MPAICSFLHLYCLMMGYLSMRQEQFGVRIVGGQYLCLAAARYEEVLLDELASFMDQDNFAC